MPDDARPSALSALGEDARREYWAALALRRTHGLGASGICRLLRHFGSAWDAVDNVGCWPDAGVPEGRARHLLDDSWRAKARQEWDAARTLRADIILWTDARYPGILKQIDDAPALLYAVGDTSLLDSPCVAVVGPRHCPAAVEAFAAEMASGLASAGVTVVSGMAFGADASAHRAALRHEGRTIAVLAGGVDVPYPASHRELYRQTASGGLIVSEAPPGTLPRPSSFPVRNRIISGLSLGVLAAGAKDGRSGSLITARLAAEQGRSVYVPSPEALRGWYGEGTEQLLMDGAQPVWKPNDILADLFAQLQHSLRPKPEKKPRPAKDSGTGGAKAVPAAPRPEAPAEPKPLPDLPPDEAVLAGLLAGGPLSPDDLLTAAMGADTGWSAARSSAALMMLEIKGVVRRLPDSRYEVCP